MVIQTTKGYVYYPRFNPKAIRLVGCQERIRCFRGSVLVHRKTRQSLPPGASQELSGPEPDDAEYNISSEQLLSVICVYLRSFAVELREARTIA